MEPLMRIKDSKFLPKCIGILKRILDLIHRSSEEISVYCAAGRQTCCTNPICILARLNLTLLLKKKKVSNLHIHQNYLESLLKQIAGSYCTVSKFSGGGVGPED